MPRAARTSEELSLVQEWERALKHEQRMRDLDCARLTSDNSHTACKQFMLVGCLAVIGLFWPFVGALGAAAAFGYAACWWQYTKEADKEVHDADQAARSDN